MPYKSGTALYLRIKRKIDAERERLNKDTLTPWTCFHRVKIFQIKRFDGSPIRYGEIEFSGSPQDVFWNGFIEPFLEDSAIKTLEWTTKQCEINNLPPDKPLDEAAGLLKRSFQRLYERMMKIDRQLRGRDFPGCSTPKNISDKITRISQFIDEYLNSVKELWVSRNRIASTKPESAQPKPESKSKKKRDDKFTRSDPDRKIQNTAQKLKDKKVPKSAAPYHEDMYFALTGKKGFIDKRADYEKETGRKLSTVKRILNKIYK